MNGRNDRIARLEWRVRLLTATVLALPCLLCLPTLMADQPPDAVRAMAFEVVDASGAVVAKLTAAQDEWGGSRLEMGTAAGGPKIALSANNSNANLTLSDGNAVRVGLHAAPTRGGVELFDRSEVPVVWLTAVHPTQEAARGILRVAESNGRGGVEVTYGGLQSMPPGPGVAPAGAAQQ